ncbi:MAG: FAD-binding oxidoreductase [Candidatus Leucobacter sulfamidivorax]|nr:FAD-binding oxidoreductase [Candidatus Leucobacter sulfamidivorax]
MADRRSQGIAGRIPASLTDRGIAPEAIQDPAVPSRAAAGTPDTAPLVRVRCRDESDVLAAITACAGLGVPISVLGGGYSPGALGEAAGTVCLDLAGLDRIEVDPEARTVTVGGGVTAGALDRALDGTGFALNLPVPSRIGVAGAALSGGVGVLLRRLGFIGDRIVAARLVDGTGTVRQVDERRDPELLRALRGGGGNFGAVTELTLAPAPIRDFHVVQLAFAADHAAEGLSLVLDLAAGAGDDLTAVAFVRALPPLPGLDPALVGGAGVLALLVHAGEAGVAERDLGPATLHPRAAAVVAGRLTPLQLRERLEPAFPFERFGAHFRSGFADRLGDGDIEAFVDAAAPLPGPHSAFEIVPLGGAVRRGEGCAPGRDAAFMINVMGLWVEPEEAAATREWAAGLDRVLAAVRRDEARVPGFVSRDEAGSGNAGLGDAAYAAGDGPALPILRELKNRHDPHRLFTTALTFTTDQEHA